MFPEKITPDTVFPEEMEPMDMPTRTAMSVGSHGYERCRTLTVTSRASVVLEDDVRARVNGNAIVLVFHNFGNMILKTCSAMYRTAQTLTTVFDGDI